MHRRLSVTKFWCCITLFFLCRFFNKKTFPPLRVRLRFGALLVHKERAQYLSSISFTLQRSYSLLLFTSSVCFWEKQGVSAEENHLVCDVQSRCNLFRVHYYNFDEPTLPVCQPSVIMGLSFFVCSLVAWFTVAACNYYMSKTVCQLGGISCAVAVWRCTWFSNACNIHGCMLFRPWKDDKLDSSGDVSMGRIFILGEHSSFLSHQVVQVMGLSRFRSCI